jgi:hypothetical protein
MTFPRISTRTFAVAAFLFSLLTLVSTNIYFASSNSNEITGCVNKKTGILRISSKCTSSERLISWNKIGPQGVKGDTGVQGEIGATGLQGIKGDTGPKGETGATGLQGIKGDTGPQGAQANLRAVTLNYVVRLPVTFTVENNDIVNIQLAPGANCSPGTVGSRILGSSLEMVSGTTGFQMFNCTATVYVP